MTNKILIEENKNKLLEEKEKLRAILSKNNIFDGAGEFPGDYKPKFDELGSEDGENASEVENFANDLSVTGNLESRLRKIEAALQRIADGTYGKCTEGDEIEEARLKAEPAAETCIKHAQVV